MNGVDPEWLLDIPGDWSCIFFQTGIEDIPKYSNVYSKGREFFVIL